MQNKNKPIESLVKGLAGLAITGTAELIKKVKKMDKNKKAKLPIPTQNRVGLNDKTKNVNSYQDGGKS